jgi:hypothetical protein
MIYEHPLHPHRGAPPQLQTSTFDWVGIHVLIVERLSDTQVAFQKVSLLVPVKVTISG